MQAAFPMYVLAPLQADMRALWAALRRLLPGPTEETPRFDDPLGGEMPDDLLLVQYCGFPYVMQWRDKLAPLACLHYAAPYCEGPMHRSVVVVAKDSAFQALADVRGRRAAINGYDSNTGMNLLRHAVAPLAEHGRFFGDVVETGAHAQSVQAVAEGQADVASIDCVTFAYLTDHMPEWTQRVRIIATTAESPALPLFTRADASENTRNALYGAWQAVLADPRYADLLKRLRIAGISRITDGQLQKIADYAREAADQGYAELR